MARSVTAKLPATPVLFPLRLLTRRILAFFTGSPVSAFTTWPASTHLFSGGVLLAGGVSCPPPGSKLVPCAMADRATHRHRGKLLMSRRNIKLPPGQYKRPDC